MVKSDVIYEKMLFIDMNIDEREEIIDYILQQAEDNNLISGVSELKQAVIDRENEVSTSIGFDIAMPHGKSDTVLQPFVAFLRTKKALHWNEENEETVRLIFLIAVPNENTDNMHLKFISQISKKLLDDEFRNVLLIEKDKEKVYELLKSIKIN